MCAQSRFPENMYHSGCMFRQNVCPESLSREHVPLGLHVSTECVPRVAFQRTCTTRAACFDRMCARRRFPENMYSSGCMFRQNVCPASLSRENVLLGLHVSTECVPGVAFQRKC